MIKGLSTGKVPCVQYEDKDTGKTVSVIQMINFTEWKNKGNYHRMKRIGHNNVRYAVANITSIPTPE